MLPSMEIERMSVENWNVTFNININGMFYVTRFIKPHMVSVKGTIIKTFSYIGKHYKKEFIFAIIFIIN